MTSPTSTPSFFTRRRFVGLLGAGALGTAALGLAAWRDRLRLPAPLRGLERRARGYVYGLTALEDRIARHYDYLTLDRVGVARFVADYERAFGPTRRRPSAERDLYERFLMSSDFFVNGADESRTVRYVTLHDPYTSPCWNPFPPASV
jgi:hypothetical protein